MGRIYRDWVRAHATAKRSNRAVLNVIADFAKDEDGTAFPSYTTLADATGLSERTIMRCINSLIKDGDLERVECKTGRGNKQGLKIIKKGDNKTQKGDNDDIEKGDNGAQKGDNGAERVTTTTEKGDNDDSDTIYGTVLEPDLEPRVNRAREDRPVAPAQPPTPPALSQSDVDEFIEATNIPAHALPPVPKPPFQPVLDDPPSGPPQARQFDPRKLEVGGLWPEGTGRTPYEVYRESYATIPSVKQIRHMNANVFDLDRWRDITNECALRGFMSYKNVFDVYQHGFRSESNDQNTSRTNPSNSRQPAPIERRALGQPPAVSRKRAAELFEGLPLL